MMNFFKKLLKPSSLFLLIIVSLVSFSVVHAATLLIDASASTARLYSDTDNQVNFRPDYMDGANPVYTQVEDSELTGFAWGNTIGWVNLNSTNCDANGDGTMGDGNFSFCPGSGSITPFKVSRSGNTLSGFAFSENGGWINFGPFTGGASQVTIDLSSGEWEGFAWIQNYGWLQFDCSQPNACVKVAIAAAPGGGGGGGSQQINGVCGSSNGGTFSSEPPTGLCSSGTPTAVSGDGSAGNPWIWDCLGQNGGFDNYPNNQQCTAYHSPDAPPPPSDTCNDTAATNYGEEADCTYSPLISPTTVVVCDGGDCSQPPIILISPTTGIACDTGDCSQSCDPAVDSNCSPDVPLTSPTTAVVCNEDSCEVIPGTDGPTCTGPDCTITPDGGCVGSDCSGGGTPGGGVLGSIFPPEVIKQISGTLNDPTVSAVTKVITTAGLVLGASAAIMAALFASPIVLGDIALIPLKLWTLLLSFLGIKKKSPPWGTVFDSITMQPLDPAYVVLKNAQGSEIATSLTDIDGRYGFPVEPGTYKIFTNKSDYAFPSAKLAGRTSTSLYKDLYFGEDIIVKQSGEIITKNIPMDRLNFNWNEFEKNQKNLMKFYKSRNKIISEISSFLFGVGFTVATVALIFAPQGYNIAIFGLYVLLFILRNTNILKAKKNGSLMRADGTPLSFAIVRVYPAAIPDVEITHRVTDKFGNFYALVPNGNYIIKVDQKTGDDSYQTVFTSPPTAISKGLIDQKFII